MLPVNPDTFTFIHYPLDFPTHFLLQAEKCVWISWTQGAKESPLHQEHEAVRHQGMQVGLNVLDLAQQESRSTLFPCFEAVIHKCCHVGVTLS